MSAVAPPSQISNNNDDDDDNNNQCDSVDVANRNENNTEEEQNVKKESEQQYVHDSVGGVVGQTTTIILQTNNVDNNNNDIHTTDANANVNVNADVTKKSQANEVQNTNNESSNSIPVTEATQHSTQMTNPGNENLNFISLPFNNNSNTLTNINNSTVYQQSQQKLPSLQSQQQQQILEMSNAELSLPFATASTATTTTAATVQPMLPTLTQQPQPQIQPHLQQQQQQLQIQLQPQNPVPRGTHTTIDDFLNVALTTAEKRKLRLDLLSLPPEKLGEIVYVLQKSQPQNIHQKDDELEIDLKRLNTKTLRHLQRYVESVFTKVRYNMQMQNNPNKNNNNNNQSANNLNGNIIGNNIFPNLGTMTGLTASTAAQMAVVQAQQTMNNAAAAQNVTYSAVQQSDNSIQAIDPWPQHKRLGVDLLSGSGIGAKRSYAMAGFIQSDGHMHGRKKRSAFTNLQKETMISFWSKYDWKAVVEDDELQVAAANIGITVAQLKVFRQNNRKKYGSQNIGVADDVSNSEKSLKNETCDSLEPSSVSVNKSPVEEK